MIKEIGNYFLTQEIDCAQGLKEFSDEEYLTAENLGMKRTLEDEKMFNGISVEFASIPWETTMIGSIKGKIYKICLQLNSTSKKTAKKGDYSKITGFIFRNSLCVKWLQTRLLIHFYHGLLSLF